MYASRMYWTFGGHIDMTCTNRAITSPNINSGKWPY